MNVHTYDPGMVLGYLAIMDQRQARSKTRGGRRLGDILAEALHGLSGRRSPEDTPELFEAATLVVVDFRAKPPAFFQLLVNHVRVRNPLIDRAVGSGGDRRQEIGDRRGTDAPRKVGIGYDQLR
ncbi:MAG TPA: hypothetical protein VFS26_00375 [Solirubrobacterales bacterium]|nr:hypothetical protein [Solirubrobacterales bacterium]